MAEKISLHAYSKLRHLAPRAVVKAADQGRISFEPKGNMRLVDPDIADREWRENSAQDRGRNLRDRDIEPAPEENIEADGLVLDISESASYAEAQRVKERYKALQAKLNFERDLGLLVSADEVAKEWARIVTIARTKILSLPSKIKGRIPELKAADIAMIEKLVREALEDLSK